MCLKHWQIILASENQCVRRQTYSSATLEWSGIEPHLLEFQVPNHLILCTSVETHFSCYKCLNFMLQYDRKECISKTRIRHGLWPQLLTTCGCSTSLANMATWSGELSELIYTQGKAWNTKTDRMKSAFFWNTRNETEKFTQLVLKSRSELQRTAGKGASESCP